MLAELQGLTEEPQLIGWAEQGLSCKNQLVEADANRVEELYRQRLAEIDQTAEATQSAAEKTPDPALLETPSAILPALAFPKETPRKRSKAHLQFIAAQPCLVCHQSPVDAHHLKYAQPRALGRKVSDEYTVPLCRAHHQDLHRYGNEKAWWSDIQIDPLPIACELWRSSPVHLPAGVPGPQPGRDERNLQAGK